ncbi:UNVERIFIED_CONTAM: hypothetical protein K2H54_074496 [Gekko kuhli]
MDTEKFDANIRSSQTYLDRTRLLQVEHTCRIVSVLLFEVGFECHGCRCALSPPGVSAPVGRQNRQLGLGQHFPHWCRGHPPQRLPGRLGVAWPRRSVCSLTALVQCLPCGMARLLW